MRISNAKAKELGLGHLVPPVAKRKRSHTPGEMNRTERRFAETLDARLLCGEIKGWEFEAEALPLGPEMRFTPDFKVEELDGSFTYVDTKGKHVWEDSVVKAKTAAVLYPQHRFCQAKWTGTEWKVRWFKSGASSDE